MERTYPSTLADVWELWTTVAGLACSILLSASFALKLPAWVDAAEKNLEAWDARRHAKKGPPA